MALVWSMGSSRVLVVSASEKDVSLDSNSSRLKQGQTNGTKGSALRSKFSCFAMNAKLIGLAGGLGVTSLVQRRLSLQSKLAKIGELIEFFISDIEYRKTLYAIRTI